MTEKQPERRKRRLPSSLNAKMLYTILLGFACALIVMAVVRGVGNLIVDKVYMSSDAISSRKAEIYSQFSSYVSSRRVKGDDSAAVARWTRDHEYVTILIYKGRNFSMRVHGGEATNASNIAGSERSQYIAQSQRLYPMRFADGLYQIAISENSQVREYALANVVAWASACLIFIAVVLWYVQRMTKRIIVLSHEAGEIGGGDLEHNITVKGNDELSMLAHEVDMMRSSAIEKMGNERRAWQANSELITAISHDIRTPMTSMLGYLSLLDENGISNEEQAKQFISAAYGKAMDLKDLTDELFKYFLVFGRADLEMNMEEFDARMLLDQFMLELQFDLQDDGFNVSRIDFIGDCRVSADTMYLKRVFDNLLSNLRKYADKSRPVMILSALENGWLSVCVSNYVVRSMNRVESTKIGIRTCEKIMTHMGGSFEIRSDEEHFAAELKLPAIENDVLPAGK